MNMHRSNVLLLMKFSKLTHRGKVLCYETALCVCLYIYMDKNNPHTYTYKTVIFIQSLGDWCTQQIQKCRYTSFTCYSTLRLFRRF